MTSVKSRMPHRGSLCRASGTPKARREQSIAEPNNVNAVGIRRATPADTTAIGRLGALLVRLHHDLDPKRFIPATSRTEQGYGSFLGSQLDEPNIVVLVAERDGEVIGYTYAGVEGRDYMSLRGPAGVLYDIAGAAWVACWSMPRWRRSKLAARPRSCSRRQSETNRRSACSLARAFGGR